MGKKTKTNKYDIFKFVKGFDPEWLYKVFYYFSEDIKNGKVNKNYAVFYNNLFDTLDNIIRMLHAMKTSIHH